MAIRRFAWTTHARERLPERGLARAAVERAIRDQHPMRKHNEGGAQWQLDAGHFVVVYDHPHENDIDAVCVVTVWRKRRRRRRHLQVVEDEPEGESKGYPEQ